MALPKIVCDGIYFKTPDEENISSPCKKLPIYGKMNGKNYCVLHLPIENKLEVFGNAVMKKFQDGDYNYRGIWIPDNFFFNRQVFKSKADFTYSYFNGDANFEQCVFKEEAHFEKVIFDSKVIFDNSTFGKFTTFFDSTFKSSASFVHSKFGVNNLKSRAVFFQSNFDGNASFYGTDFDCEVEFASAIFNEVANFEFSSFTSNADFESAFFKSSVKFSGEYIEALCYNGSDEINKVFGDGSSLNLQFSNFEKPERVSFHTVMLKPHWFVNVDARKFEFIDIEWKNLNKNSETVSNEIEDLTSRKHQSLVSPYKLFSIACKRLATNAEENNNYDDSSVFRYLAMESQRLDKTKNQSYEILNWFYWLLSGYGEDWKRAFCWLIGILIFSAVLYATPLCIFKEDMSSWNTFGYSLNVFALQRPEPRPANWFATLIVGFEAVFAPLQAALLILAIRRKFMR